MYIDRSVKSLSLLTRLDILCLPRGLLDLMLGNHPQIVGDHPPADPALYPFIAMVATAVQPMTPFQTADAAFDACTPVPAAPEPALPLVR